MIEDEPQFNVVVKMVLWGEDRDAVLHRLRVNGIEEKRALEIYEAARRERIATIRSAGFRDLWISIAMMLSAVALAYFLELDQLSLTHFGEGLGQILVLPWLITLLVVILLTFGLWKCLRAIAELVFAPLKKGSVADD